MDDKETCNTRLRLGVGEYVPEPKRQDNINSVVQLDLSFKLCPKVDTSDIDHKVEGSCSKSVRDQNPETKSCDSADSFKNCERKKLRLTKQQLGRLEHIFKLRTTLRQSQKQAIAEQLNLQQRQVEVWFQNRRARSKLKQTEVDCEFLKKCCETLRYENQRLHKELRELEKLLCYADIEKQATITICPSCEKTDASGWEEKM